MEFFHPPSVVIIEVGILGSFQLKYNFYHCTVDIPKCRIVEVLLLDLELGPNTRTNSKFVCSPHIVMAPNVSYGSLQNFSHSDILHLLTVH